MSGRSVLRLGRDRACGRLGCSRGRRRPASPAASVSTPRKRRIKSPWGKEEKRVSSQTRGERVDQQRDLRTEVYPVRERVLKNPKFRKLEG